jgi:hypothetical protein
VLVQKSYRQFLTREEMGSLRDRSHNFQTPRGRDRINFALAVPQAVDEAL